MVCTWNGGKEEVGDESTGSPDFTWLECRCPNSSARILSDPIRKSPAKKAQPNYTIVPAPLGIEPNTSNIPNQDTLSNTLFALQDLSRTFKNIPKP